MDRFMDGKDAQLPLVGVKVHALMFGDINRPYHFFFPV